MTWSVILSSSVVSALLGAVVKAIWDRRTAKKAAKTEMRAEAYRDFVVHVVRQMNIRSTQTADNPANADFHELIARLLLFGESEVVNAAAQLTKHDSLSSEEAKRDFGAVVMEMRKSLLTGHDMPVIKSAMTLAGAKSWPDPKGSLMRNV